LKLASARNGGKIFMDKLQISKINSEPRNQSVAARVVKISGFMLPNCAVTGFMKT
jgi:hypothetical protein